MNIARLIKALEKAGLQVKTDINGTYYCVSENYKCSIFRNGEGSDRCVAVQVMRNNENNDSQTDYFPGHFCRTIKSVVLSMQGK